MENSKKNGAKVLAGSIIASALFSTAAFTTNAEGLLGYSALGSGSEVRSELIGKADFKNLDLACGEKKEEKKGKEEKAGEKKDGKSKDHKCGEGKCGDKKPKM